MNINISKNLLKIYITFPAVRNFTQNLTFFSNILSVDVAIRSEGVSY